MGNQIIRGHNIKLVFSFHLLACACAIENIISFHIA